MLKEDEINKLMADAAPKDLLQLVLLNFDFAHLCLSLSLSLSLCLFTCAFVCLCMVQNSVCTIYVPCSARVCVDMCLCMRAYACLSVCLSRFLLAKQLVCPSSACSLSAMCVLFAYMRLDSLHAFHFICWSWLEDGEEGGAAASS